MLKSKLPIFECLLAKKSVKQNYRPAPRILSLMEDFRQMTNDCIRVGLTNYASTLKRLSTLSYKQLERYQVPSYYKLCAISRAAGILSSRTKSIRRGHSTKSPYVKRPTLTSCYGFRVSGGRVLVPVGGRGFEKISLNAHTLQVLSDSALKVNSFTLTENSLSLCISKEVAETKTDELAGTIGVDRNLRNVTVGNAEKVSFYDMTRVVEIGENTRSIVRSFKRNDVRVRRSLFSKYGRRKRERTAQILHIVSRHIVEGAKKNSQAIVFEDIRGIRGLYRKGNSQRRTYRYAMNSWQYGEIKRQIEYKAAWAGVLVIRLTKSETRGTSSLCPRCGERLQSDRERPRQLWCNKCGRREDRDVVAVMNISRRGWLRFDQSKGGAGEAMVQKRAPQEPLILKVDASKLTSGDVRIPAT